MDYHEFLRTRRSIRRFHPSPVSQTVIERILTTATYAPSAHNRQPWRFAVVATADGRSRLAEAMAADFRHDLEHDGLKPEDVEARVDTSRARINGAPLVIVLCLDETDMDVYPDARRAAAEHLMAVQSTANAGMALLLAVHAEGLGATWSCAPLFAPVAVKTTLQLPGAWEPQALFFIGQPAGSPSSRARRPLQDIILEA